MISTSLTRVFGGTSSDVVNFASASDVDDLHASSFHVCAIVYRTANASNLWVAQKGVIPNGWQFLLDDDGVSAYGFPRLLVWRAGGLADVHANGSPVPLNTPYVVACSWNPSGTPKLFVGTLTGTVAEVSSYLSQTTSSGAAVTDAGADLLAGNDASGGSVFKGEEERLGIGTGEITAAQVQVWRDTALAQGDLLLAYMGNTSGGLVQDQSGHSRTGTITNTTTATARDPIYIVESGDLWDADTPSLKNQYAANEYLYRSTYAPIKLTCAATLVDVTAWVTYYDSARASMTSVTVDQDGAYGGQKKFTVVDAYNRGTITLGAAGTTLEVLTGPRSRRTGLTDGTEPQQGTFPTTLRFSTGGSPTSATLVSPTTPSTLEIIVSDSIVGEGFIADPCGQHACMLQRRRSTAGSQRVAFASYGGLSWYIDAKDSTAITAFTGRLGQYAGTIKHIVLVLGTNDTGIWTAAAMATQISAALPSILAVTGVTRVTLCVPVLTLDEANTHGGNGTFQDFRDAILALSPVSGVKFVNSKAFLSSGNITDTLHATNTGQDEMYTNFTTALAVSGIGHRRTRSFLGTRIGSRQVA